MSFMPARSASVLAALVAVVLGHSMSNAAGAQTAAADDPILVQNATAAVRKSDYERELDRLPADIRPGFANSERRVNDLLRRMLMERTLAAQARAEKLDQQPEHAARLAAEIDRLYAQLKIADVEESAAREFDAKLPGWEQRARELYTVDRAKYATPEQLTASHILFDTKTRPRDEALKLANEARAKVVGGADFNQLARELSDDRTAKQNGGKLDWFSARDMDPAFAKAAFALKQPGDVSEPVLSSYGWHVIKLEARRPSVQKPFEEVRTTILSDLKQKYVSEQRDAFVAKLRTDPSIRADSEAIGALVFRVDQDALRRALQQSAPGAMAPPAK